METTLFLTQTCEAEYNGKSPTTVDTTNSSSVTGSAVGNVLNKDPLTQTARRALAVRTLL